MECISSKVLVVEDSALNAAVLKDVLCNTYDLEFAADGESVLNIVLETQPDIILLDLVLPDIDGYEVCRRLKSNPKTKDIPVIFLTGRSELEDEMKGFELGAVDYIIKPISPPLLRARLKTHLQLRIEKCNSDQLIKNILPSSIVEELKATGKTTPVCFEKAAVFFSDLVGFTRISSKMSPVELIAELNDLFTIYDEIIESNNCERIKTIGDAYMAVSGMSEDSTFYADNIVKSAIEILCFLKQRVNKSQYPWATTIGIDSGEVVGGVVGVKKYIYDIFGSTVNMASRLEGASKIYKLDIIISDSVYDDIQNPENFCLREIDTVRVKGEEHVLKLYEVFDCDEESLRACKKETLPLFTEAMMDYRAGNFADSLSKFTKCSEVCPEDFLPQLYIKRCSTLMRLPLSKDWEGVSGI